MFSGFLDVMWYVVNPVEMPEVIDAPHINLFTGGPISFGAAILFALAHVPILVGINLLPLDRWIGRLARGREPRASAGTDAGRPVAPMAVTPHLKPCRSARCRIPMPVSRTVDISVAAPAYNEADNIAAAVTEWREYLESAPGDRRVGDRRLRRREHRRDRRHPGRPCRPTAPSSSSSDSTATGERAPRSPRRSPAPGWTGSCCSTPTASSRSPTSTRFLGPILAGDGVAFSGARIRKADGLPYRWGSAASGAVSNVLHRTRYRDFNSIFKVVRGPLFRALPLESGGMNCSTEITARVAELGHTWVEIPIEHRERGGGRVGGGSGAGHATGRCSWATSDIAGGCCAGACCAHRPSLRYGAAT